MLEYSTRTTFCVICNKQPPVATCECCQKKFCLFHLNEHCQRSLQRMNQIDHNEIHPLIADIDRWEQDSIETTKKVANQARTNIQRWIEQTQQTLENIETASFDILNLRVENSRKDATKNEDLKRWIEQASNTHHQDEQSSSDNDEYVEDDDKDEPFVTVATVNELETTAPRNRGGTYRCGGRTCNTCGRCFDWFYKGDQATWKWISNGNNWTESDWKQWRGDKNWEYFEKMYTATCRYRSLRDLPYYGEKSFGRRHLCLC